MSLKEELLEPTTDLDFEIPLSYVKPDMLCYVAGSYTAKLPNGGEDHARVAERMRVFSLCVGKLTDLGVKCASPLMMHMIRQHRPDMPGDWDFWGTYSRVMLKQCHAMIVLTIEGYDTSKGVTEEMEFALENGIPMIFVDPKDLIGDAAEAKVADSIPIKVSRIQNPFKRRLAIAASFVPMYVGNNLILFLNYIGGLLRIPINLIKGAMQVW